MMKRIKKNLGKVLVLLCACLTIGTVVNAAGNTSTDVDITIEANEKKQVERDLIKPEDTSGETVQTGDSKGWLKYIVAFGCGLIVIIGGIRKKRKGMLAVFALLFTILFTNNSVLAAEAPENVNVTIPTNISISFDESGENSISRFDINN